MFKKIKLNAINDIHDIDICIIKYIYTHILIEIDNCE